MQLSPATDKFQTEKQSKPMPGSAFKVFVLMFPKILAGLRGFRQGAKVRFLYAELLERLGLVDRGNFGGLVVLVMSLMCSCYILLCCSCFSLLLGDV